MRAAAILLVLSAFSSLSYGESCEDAARLNLKIRNAGPKPNLELLDDAAWNSLIAGIESGTSCWLKVGARLRAFSDAGYSEMLSLAAGVALEHNARGVLSIWPRSALSDACSSPDLSDARTDTPKKAAQYMDVRIAAVARIRGEAARQCLRSLNESRSFILSSNGPFR